MTQPQKIMLELPVLYYYKNGHHVLVSYEATDKLLDIPVVVQKNTKEDAIKAFWITVSIHLQHLNDRSCLLDRVHPLQIGPWKHRGGRWFSTFGLNFYFRVGKGMKGGFYLPFTNLNVSFSNYWKNRKKIKINK